jgi:hypothetical protein
MTGKCLQTIALAAVLGAAAPASRADAIAEWNTIALETVTASSRTSGQALAALATVHVAMFEALNFVDPRYPPRYTVASRGQPGIPADAVAAGAAHHILRELYPAKGAVLDRALKRSLDAVADQRTAYSSAITGRSIAQIVWAVRAAERNGARREAAAAFDRVNGRDSWSVDVRGLNAAVDDSLESRHLDAVEGARLHALASEAAAASERSGDAGSAGLRAAAAVRSVLESELEAPVATASAKTLRR